MNCTNCGAPLTPVEGRGYFRCDFCTTFQFPEPLENSPDHIVPMDEQVEQDCPACELPLSLGAMEGYVVLYCGKCRGVLTTNNDFTAILGKRRANGTEPVAEPVPLKPEELKRRIECPGCGGRMDTHPYHGPGNAVIDTCVRCRLIWFDSGEITAIIRAPERRASRRGETFQEETLFARHRQLQSSTGDSWDAVDELFWA